MPTWPAQAGTTALREEQMTVSGEGMPTGHRMGPCGRGSADNLQDVTLVGNDTGGRSFSCSCATGGLGPTWELR